MLRMDVITAGTVIRESMEIHRARALRGGCWTPRRQNAAAADISAIQEVERDYHQGRTSIVTLKDPDQF